MNNGHASHLTVVLWNTEWAKPGTARADILRREILSVDPDIICLTEAVPEMMPAHGHTIEPADEPPYPRSDGGQKALLWSRWPWQHAVGSLPDGTTGRFVEGVTGPSGSQIRFTGVCIPWHDSHVHSGRKDRARWEDHLAYIRALGRRAVTGPSDIPEVLLGDYNQRIPKYWQRADVFEALMAHLDDWDVPTAGWDEPGEALIDHVAVRLGATAVLEHVWPMQLDGVRLSDHVGLQLTVSLPARG